MPPQYQYDTPPRPRGAVLPVYPYALLREKADGNATVALLVDTDGKVIEVVVVQATRPEFGQALAAAANAFVFDPALRDGQPTQTVMHMKQEFAFSALAYNDLTMPDDTDRSLFHREVNDPATIITKPKALDSPIKPLSCGKPKFPYLADAKINEGQAVIEFLINEDGHARLPRIASATDPAFGYAAVQAVSQWLFDPPTAGGKPAVVRVKIPVAFKREVSGAGTQ
jgi:TonB family protein